jgi:hypothetical protein
MHTQMNRAGAGNFEMVDPLELVAIEGGIGGLAILAAAGVLIGGTVIVGGYLAGKVAGATSDECKK